jgi:hypothetical protein
MEVSTAIVTQYKCSESNIMVSGGYILLPIAHTKKKLTENVSANSKTMCSCYICFEPSRQTAMPKTSDVYKST